MKICISAILTSMAISLYTPQLNAMTFKLAPKENKTIGNHLMWTLNANCQVQGSSAVKKVRVRMLKEQGNINGHHLTKGQTTSLTLKNQDRFMVSANAGAEVYLQNLSQDDILAICSV